ncbi:MAG: ATP synthase F1 subunit epsilon [Candidatus Neomarinimicrobiota bacterium]|jgi:F-type H+-transporting ATPase subunit epsilon|nr:ATP synthase F1 subunit epsilon [Candidatus Neomarinimicrobiota bacterium]
MGTFNLEVVTPTHNLEEMVVSYVRCPGLDGSFGIMANHQEGIFSLDIGEIMIKTKSETKYLSTSGGFAEIVNDGVSILVETVESASDIDIPRAEAALQRARDRKSSSDNENLDQARLESALSRALNRLQVAKK